MFFSTFEPYIDKNEIILQDSNDDNDNNCFICYQIQKNSDKNSVKMNNIKKYTKLCDCNLFIHISCLDEWFIINKDCPVCRNKITIYKSLNIIDYTNKILNTSIHVFLYMLSLTYYYIIYIYCSVFILNIYHIFKNK